MSLSSISSASFDGELTDSDFNPLYDLIEVIAEVAADFTDWYDDAIDRASTGADWISWFSEVASGDSSLSGQDADERTEFMSWLDTISFSPKYFDFSDGVVSGVNSDYEASEVLELLSVAVDTLSTNAGQVLIFTQALIDDYNDSSEEVMDLTDAVRDAGRGHIRT